MHSHHHHIGLCYAGACHSLVMSAYCTVPSLCRVRSLTGCECVLYCTFTLPGYFTHWLWVRTVLYLHFAGPFHSLVVSAYCTVPSFCRVRSLTAGEWAYLHFSGPSLTECVSLYLHSSSPSLTDWECTLHFSGLSVTAPESYLHFSGLSVTVPECYLHFSGLSLTAPECCFTSLIYHSQRVSATFTSIIYPSPRVSATFTSLIYHSQHVSATFTSLIYHSQRVSAILNSSGPSLTLCECLPSLFWTITHCVWEPTCTNERKSICSLNN